MSDLKPCPFCKSDAWLIENGGTDRWGNMLDQTYVVQCKDFHKCKAGVGAFDEKQLAIEAWNKRA